MQFSADKLFSEERRNKLVPCWLAATDSEKSFKKRYKSSTIKEIDVAHIWYVIHNSFIYSQYLIFTMNIHLWYFICIISDEIHKEIQLLTSEGRPESFIMYLSSQLMSGITRIHSYQVAYYQSEFNSPYLLTIFITIMSVYNLVTF